MNFGVRFGVLRMRIMGWVHFIFAHVSLFVNSPRFSSNGTVIQCVLIFFYLSDCTYSEYSVTTMIGIILSFAPDLCSIRK